MCHVISRNRDKYIFLDSERIVYNNNDTYIYYYFFIYINKLSVFDTCHFLHDSMTHVGIGAPINSMSYGA